MVWYGGLIVKVLRTSEDCFFLGVGSGSKCYINLFATLSIYQTIEYRERKQLLFLIRPWKLRDYQKGKHRGTGNNATSS